MANPMSSPKKEENRSGTHQAMDKAREAGSQVLDKAKGAASAVGDMAANAASAVGQTVSSAASTVGHKADDWTSNAGAGLKQLGETIAQKAPQEGMLGSASQAVADTVTNTGKYIEEAGLSGMMEDLGQVIRRNPFPAVLIGLGLGVLIGRTLRS